MNLSIKNILKFLLKRGIQLVLLACVIYLGIYGSQISMIYSLCDTSKFIGEPIKTTSISSFYTKCTLVYQDNNVKVFNSKELLKYYQWYTTIK